MSKCKKKSKSKYSIQFCPMYSDIEALFRVAQSNPKAKIKRDKKLSDSRGEDWYLIYE